MKLITRAFIGKRTTRTPRPKDKHYICKKESKIKKTDSLILKLPTKTATPIV